jgi:hypothetical protein
MRRLILGSILAAGLALPAAAMAKQATGMNTRTPVSTQGTNVNRDRFPRTNATGPTGGGIGTLGSGAVGGNVPGHVDSPGATKIDPDSRGPINDVQPGRGTDDTPQSANPPPAR